MSTIKNHSKTTDATREAFLDAFFQLAHRKKISRITIHEITALAGYNRTTFYRYLEDIYSLIEYSENEFLQNTRQMINEQCGERQFEEGHFFKTLIQSFHENQYRISVLLSEENRSHFLRRISENVAGNLYQPENDTPKKKVTRDIYFFGILHAICINLDGKIGLSDDDLLDIIQKMFDNWYKPQMLSNE